MEITTIGLDIAKRVFQAHGVDAGGKAVLRRKLQRAEVLGFFQDLPPCLVGIEACGTAHHWAREIKAFGHQVRLMPASYVKPYVKRGKTDAADAEAICEAVARPTMRFVPVKSAEQQAVLMLHRTRELLVRQRTALVNALRGHMAELGIVAPQELRAWPTCWPYWWGKTRQACRRWRVRPCGGWRRNWRRWASGWRRSRQRSWPGTRTMRQAAALPRSLASADHGVSHRGPPSSTPPSSSLRVTSRPGSGWYPSRTAAAASSGKGGISKQGDRTLRRLLVLGATR
jgi:transposase